MTKYSYHVIFSQKKKHKKTQKTYPTLFVQSEELLHIQQTLLCVYIYTHIQKYIVEIHTSDFIIEKKINIYIDFC